MRAFQIGDVLQNIKDSLEAGLEPDPAKVALLVTEGPKAIEEFWDLIDMTQADADLLATRIKDLQGRKAAREQAVERMKGALQDILNRHFGGKIKTATLTTWTQRTPTYEVSGADATKHPQFFKTPEPTIQKAKIIEQFKAGVAMPEDINVTEGFSESVRVKR